MSTRFHMQFNQPGGILYMTLTVVGWKPVFIKKAYLDILIRSLLFFQNSRDVKTVGYCIMPGHIHWIFKLPEIKPDLIKIVRTFKSYTATQCIKLLQSEINKSSVARFMAMGRGSGGLSVQQLPLFHARIRLARAEY